MYIIEISLIIATLLCSLVSGLLFAFAAVVMPGIGKLSDKEFLKSFQIIDKVIQNRQPAFMIIWVGSIVAIISTVVIGVIELEGIKLILLLAASLFYLVCVQLITIVFNIPLNNRLQTFHLDRMDRDELKIARTNFEPNWNRWNLFRTIFSVVTSLFLIFLVFTI